VSIRLTAAVFKNSFLLMKLCYHLTPALALCLKILSASLLGDTIDVRLLGVGKTDDAPNRYLKTDHAFQKLDFSTRQPSEAIRAEANRCLALYKEVPEGGPAPSYQIAQELDLPEGAKHILLVALHAKNETHYRVIEDDFTKVTFKEYLFVNTTSRQVFIRIGPDKKAFKIEAKASKTWTIDPGLGQSLPVTIQADFDNKIKTVYSTYWRIRENERSIIVLDEVESKVKVTKIGDRLKTAETAPQEGK